MNSKWAERWCCPKQLPIKGVTPMRHRTSLPHSLRCILDGFLRLFHGTHIQCLLGTGRGVHRAPDIADGVRDADRGRTVAILAPLQNAPVLLRVTMVGPGKALRCHVTEITRTWHERGAPTPSGSSWSATPTAARPAAAMTSQWSPPGPARRRCAPRDARRSSRRGRVARRSPGCRAPRREGQHLPLAPGEPTDVPRTRPRRLHAEVSSSAAAASAS